MCCCCCTVGGGALLRAGGGGAGADADGVDFEDRDLLDDEERLLGIFGMA